jgi:hypothetical protein
MGEESVQPVGTIAKIQNALNALDIVSSQKIIASVLSQPELRLEHPLNGAITICWSSHTEGMDNYLFFADEQGANRWTLFQRESFANAFFADGHAVSLADDFDPTSHQQRILSGAFDSHWHSKKSFGGLILSSNRPFHYFYDQMMNLPWLVAADQSLASRIHHGPETFLRANMVNPAWSSLQPNTNSFYYVMPTLMGGNWRRDSRPDDFFPTAAVMEQMIKTSIVPDRKRSEFVIWIGVVGQKRSWIEQVDGYAEVINKLHSKFPSLHVLVDGLTAPQNKHRRFPEEDVLVEEIAMRLYGHISVRNLVGEDYPTKLAACATCDVAVVNGGTGSFVPLRILGKPGVVHTGGGLDAFAGASYPEDRVAMLGAGFTKDAWHPEFTRKDFISYHLRWQTVFNELLRVCPRVAQAFCPVPVPEAPFGKADLEVIGELLKPKLRDGVRVGDILMDIANFYMDKEDHSTALALAKQAALQRQGTKSDAINLINKIRRSR